MFLALVGDRTSIWPQNLCTIYPSWNVFSIHFSSVTAVPSSVWEGHGGMVLKWMYGEGNWLTEVQLEGWPLNWACVSFKVYNSQCL